MNTFRAAYIPADNGSNGAGVLLTTEEHTNLSDAELLAAAQDLAESIGAAGDIIIGEWRE